MAWPVRITTLGPITGGSVVFAERGVTYVTAIAKATFTLIHEALAMQVQARPLVTEDDLDPSGELRRAGEVAPLIPGVDVLLSGHARAPYGAPAAAVATRLLIVEEADEGSAPRLLLDKTVHAYGPRRDRDAYPETFTSLALGYARAAKPADDSVPLFVLPKGARGFASFGPLAREWPARAGLIARETLEERDGRLTLSDSFPFEFFHAAPPDQRTARISGGEWLVMDGMHADLPRFASKLPFVHAEAQLYDESGKPTPIPLKCDTLAIDMDECTCTLVFRGHVPAPTERLASLSLVASVEVSREAPLEDRALSVPPSVPPDSEPQTRRHSTAPPAAVEESAAALDTESPVTHKTNPPPALQDASNAMPFRASAPSPDARPRAPATTGGLPFGPRGVGTMPPPAPVPAPLPLGPLAMSRGAFEEDATPDHVEPSNEATPVHPSSIPPPGRVGGFGGLLAKPPPPPPPIAQPALPLETGVRGEVLGKLKRGEAFYDQNLAGADLSGIDFSKAVMSNVNLSNAKLVGCKFEGARLTGARLLGADLSNAKLGGADLSNANMTKATLASASFEGALLTDANLTLASGSGAVFDRATGQRTAFAQGTWTGASFREADLSVADFSGADLAEASLDRAKLGSARFSDIRAKGANFDGASLVEATFQGAHLDEVSFDEAELKGSTWERASISACTFKSALMGKANLARTTITKASFEAADLQGASLIGATSVESSFASANLCGVDARQTKLTDAVFEKADLRKFNAHKASLVGGRFDEANLGGASLRGARLKGASFCGADLAETDLRDADLENANLRDVKNKASAKLGGANLRGADE